MPHLFQDPSDRESDEGVRTAEPKRREERRAEATMSVVLAAQRQAEVMHKRETDAARERGWRKEADWSDLASVWRDEKGAWWLLTPGRTVPVEGGS